MKPRYESARKRATELLRKGKVRTAPVDVTKLAMLAHATIHYEALDNQISGMVTRGIDGAALIGVNASHPITRQRFTIAHEIGHLLLHDDILHIDKKFPIALRSETASLGIDTKEIEANQFAAELLIPTEFLRSDVKKLHVEEIEDAIRELADKYRVSVQAMTIRLTSLGVLS
jgi:Zn-dependent peptidase ImmA (M78 family)